MLSASPIDAIVSSVKGIVQAEYLADRRRNYKHHPGKLLYSVQFDTEKLQCLYRALSCPYCCCGIESMAEETHMDVYTNALILSRPTMWGSGGPDCCFGRPAWGLVRYYDHPVFDAPASTGPSCEGGNCFAICGYLGKFGDQLNLHNKGCLRSKCEPSLIGHVTLIKCCESQEQTYGLVEGEGARVASIINDAVAVFRKNERAYVLDPFAKKECSQALATVNVNAPNMV